LPDPVTIDFETYYTQDYSLSKMSTEDYIQDPRFEVILVAAKRGEGPIEWHSGPYATTKKWLEALQLDKTGVIAHNAMFDAGILQMRFGIRPAFIFDTISMAQAHIRPFSPRVSLKACLEYCDFDGLRKGTTVHNMLGRSRLSLSREELHTYAAYCKDDVLGEWLLFKHLKGLFPKQEFWVMDRTHRMYLDPVLELDADMLAEILQEEKASKEALLARIGRVEKADLMSNPRFAQLLLARGYDPPMKVSLATGKPTFAFAKGDPEFKSFQEEIVDDPVTTALVEARLGVKSTINETRTARLLDIAVRHKKLRVPLNYYAAHTGRYGGTQKINMQNPPRIDKSRLRFAIRAPKGHVILAADLAQIEARVVSWLAGCTPLVQAFREGRDVYSEFATKAYKRPVAPKAKTQERFVGKTCILGLGFGMGAEKLHGTLRKDNVKVELKFASNLVFTYRDTYPEIPKLWDRCDKGIQRMAVGNRSTIGPVIFGNQMLVLPNGMPIYYHALSIEHGQYCYRFGAETRTLWGGKLCENIVQALARIIVMDNARTVEQELGLRLAMQVHDELDYVVPEGQAETLAAAISEIMSIPPSWAPDLPVAVEVAFGQTFGDCK